MTTRKTSHVGASHTDPLKNQWPETRSAQQRLIALDGAIERSVADAEAARFQDVDAVRAELRERFAVL